MNYLSRNVRKLASATALILPLSPLVAFASQKAMPLSSPIGTADVISVGSGLAIVIAVIILAGLFYSRARGVRSRGRNVIQILAIQPLGPKEKIVLVQVADKQLVLGMTTSQVQTLHTFDEAIVAVPEQVANRKLAEKFMAAMRSSRK